MPAAVYQRERRRLAEALRSLRAGSGLTGAELATRLGWGQPKVSKLETGRQLPAVDDIVAWTAATGAPFGTADDLISILRGARIENAQWKDAYRAEGAGGVQEDILELETRATRIAEYQPAFMSGLVQTADYARATLHLPCGPLSFGTSSEKDIERVVGVRAQRRQALYNPDKHVTVILQEAALRTLVVPPRVLRGQLDALIDVAGLPASLNTELGIIPFDAPVPVWSLSGFRVYDDDLAIVESLAGEQQLSEADEVARYGKYLDLLRDAAVTGQAAAGVIRGALAALPMS